ncbi:hypothetical protein C0Q70_16460 [Pomacea canaliculata]|uniref:Cytochrome P450 n=1 Tax=Pomacea canaliculata TaxID=400727 RepID=A0A2T7NPU8_POMCA|nr:hypothetical protein C0Q70_16460 [Pomacea canaliculata]
MDFLLDLDLGSLLTYGLCAAAMAALFWLSTSMMPNTKFDHSSSTTKSRGRPQLPPGPTGLAGLVKFFRGLNKFELHLTATEWAKQYGEIVACNILGQNIIFLNSADISVGSSERSLVKSVLTGQMHLPKFVPRTFSGKYIFFNCQDACMSPYNSDTKRMRKALHASLRFYGDGVQQFEQTVHSEIDHVIARLHGTHDAVSGQDFENLVSDSILSVIHILLTGSRPEEGDPNVLNMREFDHWFSALLTPDIDILLQVAPWLRLFPCRAGHLWSLADGYKKKFLDYYFHHMKARTSTSSSSPTIQPATTSSSLLSYTDQCHHACHYITNKTQSPGDQRGLVNVLLAQQQSDTDQWLSDERIQCLLLNIVTGGNGHFLSLPPTLFLK